MFYNVKSVLTKIKLKELLTIQQINMPAFQREYTWGLQAETKEKPVEFFRDFLLNGKANHLDYMIGYHTGSELNLNQNVVEFGSAQCLNTLSELHLADGQHRLVTSLLSLYAAHEYLVKDCEIESEERLDLIKQFEEILNDNGVSFVEKPMLNKNVIQFLEEIKSKEQALDKELDDYKKLIETKQTGLAAAREELKKSDKAMKDELKLKSKELKISFRNKEEDIKSRRLQIRDNALFKSYESIKAFIQKDFDPYTTLLNCNKLLERISRLEISIEIFYTQDSRVSKEEVLSSFCFDLFANKNGQSVPLTTENLVQANLANKASSSELYNALSNDSGNLFPSVKTSNSLLGVNIGLKELLRYEAFYRYAADRDMYKRPCHDVNDLFTYVKKCLASEQSSTGGSELSYRLNKFYLKLSNRLSWIAVTTESPPILRRMKFVLDTINKEYLYEFVIRSLLLANSKEEFDEACNKISALLLLLEISSTVPDEGTGKPNAARNLANIHCKDEYRNLSLTVFLENCLLVLGNRFRETKEFTKPERLIYKLNKGFVAPEHKEKFKKTLESRLVPHIAQYQWGVSSNDRKFAMVMLARMNYPDNNSISSIDSPELSFEHVLPQDFGVLKGGTVSDRVINQIGNGAIVNTQYNSSLGAEAPVDKLFKTIEQAKQSMWDPESFKDLQKACSSTEGWNEKFIEARSIRISQFIWDWCKHKV